MSGLQSLLLHVVVITPVCSFLISGAGGRLGRPLNYLAAIAFLAAVAIGGEMATWQGQPPNLYRVLDVDRGASAAEMKKSYRDMSLKFHPVRPQQKQKEHSGDAGCAQNGAARPTLTRADTSLPVLRSLITGQKQITRSPRSIPIDQ